MWDLLETLALPLLRLVCAGGAWLRGKLEGLRGARRARERAIAWKPRELEVLQLIVLGRSNKEIAALLSLSANTVAVHRANIMQALGIHNTAELVVYAIRKGLVSIA